MSAPLIPCPMCGKPPSRFFVSQRRIEVIACQQGCKTHWNGFVIHVTSAQVSGWDDLGDCWNTMKTNPRSDCPGFHVSFDAMPRVVKMIEREARR